MELKGKIAVITGSSQRIGKAIALAFAAQGCHVVIHYQHSEAEAEKTKQEALALGVKAIALQADLTHKKLVDQFALEVQKKLGDADILVNNASIYKETPWPKLTEINWDDHMNVNAKAPFLCAQAFVPHMIKNQQGKIMNIVDSRLDRPNPDFIAYNVSKSALVSLTHSLAASLAPHNIQVNAIAPAVILWPKEDTIKNKISVIDKIPLRRLGDPKDVAEAALYLAQKGDYITGITIPVDGGRSLV